MKQILPCKYRDGNPIFLSGRKFPRWHFLFAMFLLSFNAVASDLLAQEVKFTIHVKNESIESVFKQIEKQSSFRILYSKKIIEQAKPVTLSLNAVSLERVLSACFHGQPFAYVIQDQSIIVSPLKKQVINPVRRSGTDSLISVKGTVRDEKGLPLPGASIKIQGTSTGVIADNNGAFELRNIPYGSKLLISFIGYISVEIELSTDTPIVIRLKVDAANLHEVIVSTGYQDLPEERATGSFVKIDSALVSRRVSTNFIDRLEGVTSGLIFNRNLSPLDPNSSPISVRGRSTIFANTKPLIIIDNFPYEGDLDNINPNDIENITILKDAAAASIWGARSANGVIVVNTKKGKLNQSLQVNINSNLTIGQKPNLFYSPNFLNSSDFIDLEKYLFNQGFYDSNLNSNSFLSVVTPVVDILAAERAGTITAANADAQINALRGKDVRNDFNKYFYRNSYNQQHSISLSGGSQNATYFFSAGYDKDISNLVRNDYDRITLNENSTYTPIKNLEFSIGVHYAQNNLNNNNPGYYGITSNNSSIYPYAQLADGNGNALAVAKDYSNSFKAAQTGLLDWSYRPLQDLYLSNNTTRVNDIRINPSLKLKFTDWLNAEVRYQYDKQFTETDNLQNKDSYYVRNLVNLYSSVDNGVVTNNIPYGDIYDKGLTDYSSSTIRGQLNFNKSIGSKHLISAIAGIEYQQQITSINQNRLYGYNSQAATSIPVPYGVYFPQYSSLTYDSPIPYMDSFDEKTNEFRSYFANASYTYNDKYTFSASARFDQSNLFGVSINNKGVPLWSAGLSWNLSKEAFYNVDWLPELKARATYGINGNIDKSLTAFTTGYYSLSDITSAPDVNIVNPPNPKLSWEKDKMLNLGLDFSSKNRRISGSLEYYHRTGNNIIGYANLDPTTGFYTFKGNVADMEGKGIDVQLSTHNITGGFKWNSTFLLSKTTDAVTNYSPTVPNGNHVQSGDGTFSGTISSNFTAVLGRPVFSVFSYKWAGLDPQTGDPMGYLNGVVSKDYGSIANSKNVSELIYNGPANPTVFGSLRNDFLYKSFSLSINITYKLGYYFRRPSVNYGYLHK